jgi:hypothetical protein
VSSELRSQWAKDFVGQGGFQHILNDFMTCSAPFDDGSQSEDTADSLELKYVAFMLHLLRTFTTAAFAGSDARILQGGLSSGQSQLLLGDQIAQEIDALVDYSALQQKVLSVTSQVLRKSKLVFEDKLIVENALNLWVCVLLHRGDLFREFAEPLDQAVKSDEFLLEGLLYCPYKTVRE